MHKKKHIVLVCNASSDVVVTICSWHAYDCSQTFSLVLLSPPGENDIVWKDATGFWQLWQKFDVLLQSTDWIIANGGTLLLSKSGRRTRKLKSDPLSYFSKTNQVLYMGTNVFKFCQKRSKTRNIEYLIKNLPKNWKINCQISKNKKVRSPSF